MEIPVFPPDLMFLNILCQDIIGMQISFVHETKIHTTGSNNESLCTVSSTADLLSQFSFSIYIYCGFTLHPVKIALHPLLSLLFASILQSDQ